MLDNHELLHGIYDSLKKRERCCEDVVVDSSGPFTIAASADITYTFAAPVSLMEVKTANTDAEQTLTIVTENSIKNGTRTIVLFANDYQFVSFEGTKIISVNILNGGTTVGDYIVNGING